MAWIPGAAGVFHNGKISKQQALVPNDRTIENVSDGEFDDVRLDDADNDVRANNVRGEHEVGHLNISKADATGNEYDICDAIFDHDGHKLRIRLNVCDADQFG